MSDAGADCRKQPVCYGKSEAVETGYAGYNDDIGRVKEKSVHRVETLMSIATLVAPVIQILSIIFGWNHMPVNARFTGFCIGMLGDLIFLTSVLCMKDSWRAGIPDKDRTKLVTEGIYR